MLHRQGYALAAAFGLALAAVPGALLTRAVAQDAARTAQKTSETEIVVGGEYAFVLTNNDKIAGKVVEVTPTTYRVEVARGIVRTVPRNSVHSVTSLARAAAGGDAGAAVTGDADKLTPEELQQILGPKENFLILEEFGEESSNAMEECPLDQEGLNQMMRIAGAGADYMVTPHFVLVYTSKRDLATELAGRLESVYRWSVRFMEMMDVPARRPDHKLEIYFFGTHKEFNAYQALDSGSTSVGVLGFYMPSTNRSAFFVMQDWPPVAMRLEQLKSKDIDGQTRRRITNLLDRWSDSYNFEVVQHEAAHHIHFNIGLFPRRNWYVRWLAEGMAQMFEAEPSVLGASLGTTNHARLKQFRQLAGDRNERFPEGYLSNLLFRDGGITAAEYPVSWALCHYLWKKDRKKFAQFLQAHAAFDEKHQMTSAEKQKIWEDAFGVVDEKWEKEFFKFMNSLTLKTDHLPEEPFP